MRELINLPVEVTTQIFSACDDISLVLALAASCKKLHSVWQTNSSVIVWRLGITSNIRSFDIALMAVRATALVLKASQANLPPPEFPSIYALSGKAQLPTVDEFKEVLNMQHLVRCVEHMYFHSSIDNDTLFGGCMLPLLVILRRCEDLPFETTSIINGLPRK
ncbi:hypothetical protein ONS95_012843 [Cadophora gregata]|uniref:uncharacterized protein n=1 Tax=Cadophora gregata TaxID=51156 RepID=UPI0026DCE007|nr:uncharacterized protein ONS95_012843 [Cadophora gregata]KAK0101176.1 hypothetical protein ONS96_006398 [Cadophora gregata f. sp. sojae]KAK0115792.1 hypothetical protein ONS95_012843 [Cadophora gregata]